MVATTWESVRTVWAAVAPWLFAGTAGKLGPTIARTSGTSATTYLLEAARWIDASNVNLSGKLLNGYWIFRPDAVAVGDRERQIGGNSGNGIDTTNGRLYPVASWTNAPNSEQYDVTYVRPNTMFDKLVESMEMFWVPDYSPVEVFADASMATSGTSNYSLSGAGSLSKVTTAARNDVGVQSLFFNAGTAAEVLEGPTVGVIPGQQYFASVNIQATAGGPFAFVIWDKTNDVELTSAERVYTTLEKFVSLQRRFTPTASVSNSSGVVTTQGCEEVALRVYCTAATDDAHIANFSGPYKATDHSIFAPSTLISDKRLRKLMYAVYGLQYSSGVYDADSRSWEEIQGNQYYLRAAHHHANPYRFEFREGYQIDTGYELWVEHLRRAADISTLAFTAAGETSPTIPIEKRLIGLDSLKRICEHVLTTEPTHTEAQATLNQITARGSEWRNMMQDYNSDLESPQYVDPPHRYALTAL